MVEEESTKKQENVANEYAEEVFECAICKRVYKEPGMCKFCNAMLRPKGG